MCVVGGYIYFWIGSKLTADFHFDEYSRENGNYDFELMRMVIVYIILMNKDVAKKKNC